MSSSSFTGLLVIACLFALVGGYLDAFSYIAHNHVFATAETGNVVLFAVYASGGEWGQAIRYLPPIAAFMLGVSVGRVLGVKSKKRTFRATLICQGVELVVLFAFATFSTQLPNAWIVPSLAFVSALQITSFSSLGPWQFNTTMTSSNIRNATSALLLLLLGHDRSKNSGQAIVSSSIFVSFLGGGSFGALYTRHDESHALLPCVFLVITGFALTWRQRLQNLRQTEVL